MLATLRNAEGGPSLRVRLLAVLVILGMLLLSAPVVIPVVRWLAAVLF
jgi:hypothetical protein